MNLFLTIFLLMIVHWVADFILQTDKQAKGKSTSVYWLSKHVLVYSSVWLLFIFFWSGFEIFNSFLFFIITFICHWVTDYITSRVGKIFWDKGDVHNGFVVIGFDQILHYVQIILTIYIIFK